jgi:glycosyltransferase involved in cell wall biosynthesis
MRFSVLVPSRNRADLAAMAIATVVQQDFIDFEVIVSDNASDDDYAAMVATFDDARITLIRTEAPLAVTANWNNALTRASGDYVIMLGDDDGLAPGSLSRLDGLIAAHHAPDVIYAMAYHYAYPNVLPESPAGFLATVKPRPIYSGQTEPFFLKPSRARHFASQALRFRHLFGFNSQFFIWRRAFIDSLSAVGAFFQSPYPDFYAAFVTMLKAERILIDPEPCAMIGISPKSFGFYFHNDQVPAGNAMLGSAAADAEMVRGMTAGVTEALDLAGSSHYRNWLTAALFVVRNYAREVATAVDLRRFRRIQVLESAFEVAFHGEAGRRSVLAIKAQLTDRECRLFERLRCTFALWRRAEMGTARQLHEAAFARFNIYPPAETAIHDIGPHRNIIQAWAWLEREVEARAVARRARHREVRPGWYWRARAWLDLGREMRLINASGVFDRDWYLTQYPDVARSGTDPLRHYLRFGAAEGRDPNPLFDTDWYLSRYPDVERSGVNPLLHYLRVGAVEGRNPNRLLDGNWYQAAYPDVRSSGMNPLVHYLRVGGAEGRDPGPEFDAGWYLARYPDVRQMAANPLAHYLRIGVAEGRCRRRKTTRDSPGC